MDHDVVAPVYDALARAWSLGAIDSARNLAPHTVTQGERVLFAGVGGGRDAAVAVARGGDVVGVDVSRKMLARATRVAGVELTVVREDVTEHRSSAPYDLVCAHYFLNIFGSARMPEVLEGLLAQVAPGGRLAIADFAPGAGLARALHYRLPLWFFRRLGLCADHPVYDYAPLLERLGWTAEITDVRMARFGPAWHRVWTARRSE